MPVLGPSDTNKYVETGTDGETAGTAAAAYPEWYREPLGGNRRVRY